MARLDKSQRWLAEETKISPATLHRRLRGNSPFLDWEIAYIANALGIDVRELLPTVNPEAAA